MIRIAAIACMTVLVVLPRAAFADGSRLQISAAGALGIETLVFPDVASQSGFVASGGVALDWFAFHPVLDDETPRALQPYLQRAGRLRLEAGVSAVGVHLGDPSGGGDLSEDVSEQRGTVRVSVDAYVGRYLTLHGDAGFVYLLHQESYGGTNPSVTQSDALVLPLRAGLGLRVGDFRIDVDYLLAPRMLDGAWQTLRWGGLAASARLVVRRRVDLLLSGRTLDNATFGAEGAFDGAVYVGKRGGQLGLLAGVHVGGGNTSPPELYGASRVGGYGGVSYWFSPRIGIGARYAVQWSRNDLATIGRLENQLLLQVWSRPY